VEINTMRIYLVAGEPIFREGLKTILQKEADLSVAGEAANCRDILQAAVYSDLLVLDGELDSLDLLNSLQKTRSNGQSPFVLILTKHREQQHAVQMLKAGADGYVYKTESVEVVLSAIRKIGTGEKHVPDDLAQTFVFVMSGVHAPRGLSYREYQVLYLFASGMGMTDIADHLSLSVKTVSTYRSRLLEKLNLRSNAELMRYAFTKGMVHEAGRPG
jgi:two-component system invasion response regulator UvrY